MDNATSQRLAEQILAESTPDSVAAIVDVIEKDHDVSWVPVGGIPNNYGQVENQASSPMTCLAELVANSNDALLLRGYSENAPPSAEPSDYPTMDDAAAAFAPDDAEVEVIADWPAKTKFDSSPNRTDYLNLVVRDNGCGQPPERLSDTILNLNTPGGEKQKYDFLQGQYGMGGSGVLQFAGDDLEGDVPTFKFVCSASYERPGEWGWSVVRQNLDKDQYEYLCVDGETPSFTGEFGAKLMNNLPAEEEVKQTSYQRFEPQEFGTFVKVYDYRVNCSKSNIYADRGFRQKYKRVMVDSSFPVRMTDARGYEDNVFMQKEEPGFIESAKANPEMLLGDEWITHDFEASQGSEVLGERDFRVFLFKDAQQRPETNQGNVKDNHTMQNSSKNTGIQDDHAIMLTVNGQTHGDLGKGTLESWGFSKTAGEIAIIGEFSDLDGKLSSLFKPSRDRLNMGKTTAKLLRDGIEEAVKSCDMLNAEEDRRRARSSGAESSVDADSLIDHFDSHPDFYDYIQSGSKRGGVQVSPDTDGETMTDVTVPSWGDEADSAADGGAATAQSPSEPENRAGPPEVPTYFKAIETYRPSGTSDVWEETDPMSVEIEAGGKTTIRFATDAQNDYLVRDVMGGDVTASPFSIRTTQLNDGVVSVTVEAGEMEAGDTTQGSITLTRPVSLSDANIEPGGDLAEQFEPDYPPLAANLTESIEIECVPAKDDQNTPTEAAGDTVEWDDDGNINVGIPDSDGEDDDGEHIELPARKQADIPDIKTVTRDQYDPDNTSDEDELVGEFIDHFDDDTCLMLDESRDGSISGLVLTINMDATPLRTFIADGNVKEIYKETVENVYLWTMVSYTLGMYRESMDTGLTDGESRDESFITTTIETHINGIAQALDGTVFSDEFRDVVTE